MNCADCEVLRRRPVARGVRIIRHRAAADMCSCFSLRTDTSGFAAGCRERNRVSKSRHMATMLQLSGNPKM